MIAQIQRDIIIQKKLDHPNIIKLLHTFEDKENIYLAMDFAENGNLETYLNKNPKLDEN